MIEYKIVATPVFKITLTRFSAFLTRKFSASLAAKTRQDVKNYLKKYLPSTPYIGHPSERLMDFGIKDYLQLMVDEHNIIIYKVDDQNKKVILLAIMDSRQSIEKLLFEVLLAYPEFKK